MLEPELDVRWHLTKRVIFRQTPWPRAVTGTQRWLNFFGGVHERYPPSTNRGSYFGQSDVYRRRNHSHRRNSLRGGPCSGRRSPRRHGDPRLVYFVELGAVGGNGGGGKRYRRG